jgi:hypothetical protein
VEFVPKPGLDLEEDAQPNPETHDQQVIVQVECKAAIQLLGQSPDDVFTGFVNRLRAETVAAGGVTVDSRPPARDNTFNFTLKFAPGN